MKSAESAPAVRPSRVIGLGRIEPELKILELAAEVTGTVSVISCRAGDEVRKGHVLVQLTCAIEEARVDQAAAKIQAQTSEVKAEEAALAAAKIRAENARLAYARAKILVEQNAQAKFNYDNAKAEYEALLEDVKRLEAGAVAARDLVGQYRADLKLARAQLEQRSVRVPADGQILSLDITLGSLVSPEKPFGTFAPKSALTAWCEIDELFAGEVTTGRKAYIRYPGTEEVLARGTVTFAGPALRKKSVFSDEVGDLEDRRVREVRIELEPGARLLFGSRIECVISVGE